MRGSAAATPGMAAICSATDFGRAPDLGKDVGEAIAHVVGRARLVERAVGAAGQHEVATPRGHDQRDGQRLRPHAPQVAQQLAVEHAHGLTS